MALPKVNNIQQENGVLTFQLQNANVSVANAIRRTILSSVESIGFITTPYEKCKVKFLKNSTNLNNEIMKQRLSCIPVHLKDLTLNLDDYIVELKVKNTTNTILDVTTKDFKIKNIKTDNYLSDSELSRIFPKNEYTKEHILFCKLKPSVNDEIPGQEIHFEAKLSIVKPSMDYAFNVASTCSYAFTNDKVKAEQVWKKKEDELKKNGISEEELIDEKENFMLLEAKRSFIKDSFDFMIESIGVFDNNYLVSRACEILLNDLGTIEENVDTQNLLIENGETMEKSYDIMFDNIDYTIGKLLEYGFYKLYFENEKALSFVNYNKPHPYDTSSFVRIMFSNEAYGKSQLYAFFKNVLIYLKQQLKSVQEQF